MVRRAELRQRRYEAGINPEVIGARFGQVKEGMVRLEGTYFPQIVDVEAKVKGLVEAAGVTTFEVAQYINVGRKCYSIARNFSQATRDAEAQRVVNHWAERGLNPTLLRKSCEAGGCFPADPPLPPGFAELEAKLDALLEYESSTFLNLRIVNFPAEYDLVQVTQLVQLPEGGPVYIVFCAEVGGVRRCYVGEIDEDLNVSNVKQLTADTWNPALFYEGNNDNWLYMGYLADRYRFARISKDFGTIIGETYPLSFGGVQWHTGGQASMMGLNGRLWIVCDGARVGVSPEGTGLLTSSNMGVSPLPALSIANECLLTESAEYHTYSGEKGHGFGLDGGYSAFEHGNYLAWLQGIHHGGNPRIVPAWAMYDAEKEMMVGGVSYEPIVPIPPSIRLYDGYALTSLLGRQMDLFLTMSTGHFYGYHTYAMKINPDVFDPCRHTVLWTIWAEKSVAVNEISPAYPGFGRKTIHFTSDTSGDLTSYLDAVGVNLWKEIGVHAGVTSVLSQTEWSGLRMRHKFSKAAKCSLYVVTELR